MARSVKCAHIDPTAWRFGFPTRIWFGAGEFERLPEAVRSVGGKKILLVTGRTAMKKTGILDRCLKLLGKRNVVHFDKIDQNPTAESMDEGAALAAAKGCDAVVALGGGSPMDAAKMIALLAVAPKRLRTVDLLAANLEYTGKRLGCICIPTTAGTGSEVTRYSVISVGDSKPSMANDMLYPHVALMDPELTVKLPPRITAGTGMDALAQSIEGYWANGSNVVSKTFSATAIPLVLKWLPVAVADPKNLAARSAMLYAAALSGMSINQSRTTMVHTASYPLTIRFHVPHGQACGMLLSGAISYNGRPRSPWRAGLWQLLGAKDATEASNRIHRLLKTIGLPNRLRDVGVAKADFDMICDGCFDSPSRLANNPVKLTRPKLKKVLDDLW